MARKRPGSVECADLSTTQIGLREQTVSHDQGRPSLFAGMEEGASPGSDTQRVRILSTLESTRRASRPARKGPLGATAAQPSDSQRAQSRAWSITLGLGVVTLLISFILIVQSQRTKPAKAAAPQAPAVAVTPSAPVWAASTQQVAQAESPLGAAAPEASAPALAASESLDAMPPTGANRDPLASLAEPVEPTAPAASVPPSQGPTTKATSTARAATSGKSTKTAKPAKPAKSHRNDSDVELIEAVMTHASSRPDSH